MDLQSDKYYTGYLVTPTYLHQVTEKIGLEVGAKYNNQQFWTPLFLSQDNRSGNLWGGNVGMYYFFKKQKGFVQARLGYWNNNTQGSNWDSNSYNLLLSLLWPITDKLKYNMFLDLTQQPFSQHLVQRCDGRQRPGRAPGPPTQAAGPNSDVWDAGHL